jgi:hypothetical protein
MAGAVAQPARLYVDERRCTQTEVDAEASAHRGNWHDAAQASRVAVQSYGAEFGQWTDAPS